MSGPNQEWLNTPLGYHGPWYTPREGDDLSAYEDLTAFHQHRWLLDQQIDDRSRATGVNAASHDAEIQHEYVEAWLKRINTAAVFTEPPGSLPPVDGYPIDYADPEQRQMASRGYVRDANGSMVTRLAYRAARKAYMKAYGLEPEDVESPPATSHPVNYASPENLTEYRQSTRARSHETARRQAFETNMRVPLYDEVIVVVPAEKGNTSEEKKPLNQHDEKYAEPRGLRRIADRIKRETAYLNARWYA